MAWSIYTHAALGDVRSPRPLARCDRCGFIYNRDRLRYQYDWAGTKQMNLGILVCHKCMDMDQPQLKTLKLPMDPIPIDNPRPGEFSGMVISSSPDIYGTVVPNFMVVQSSNDGTTQIGDRSPIVTETSSLPLMPEITVTPNPDPNYGGVGTDKGYSREAST